MRRVRRMGARLLLITILFILLASGCSRRKTYLPPLRVVGDVREALTLQTREALEPDTTVRADGERLRAVSLRTLARRAGAEECRTVILLAENGFSTELDAATLDDCFLAWSDSGGWRTVSERHPISANALALQYVIFVSDAENTDCVVTLWTAEKGEERRTIGELYASGWQMLRYPEGTAERETDGRLYTSAVTTWRRVLSPEMLGLQSESLLLKDGGEHEYRVPAQTAWFELRENRLDYLDSAQREWIEDVKQIEESK